MAPCGKKAAGGPDQAALRENAQYDEHQLSVEELEKKYGTNVKEGLSDDKAKELLEKNGPNKLSPPPATPWYVKLFMEVFGGKFNILLWFGGILCFIAFAIDGSVDNLYLGIVLSAVVTITGLFSYYQNSKSDNLMESFANMLPPEITVIRDNKKFSLEAQLLVVGDIVELVGGDLIPADIRILQCSDNMTVDNSSLTGENEPLKRSPNKTDDKPMETRNLAFFGTQIPEGSCTGLVVRAGQDTFMGKIATLAMTADNEVTPINKEIHIFINMISAIALFLGLTFFIINLVLGADLITNCVFVIGIIVANVPEGLLATVTVCLTLTANRMHTKKVMVKNLEGVETLGSTSCICSDKTGTLTQNIMTVAQCVYGGPDGFFIADCGSSFSRGIKTYDEESPAFKKLQRCATLNNDSYFDETSKEEMVDGARVKVPFKRNVVQGDGSLLEEVAWKAIGNASEAAMIKLLQPHGDINEARKNNACCFKIPFNSKNKYQVHVVCQEEFNGDDSVEAKKNRGARVVTMKGAPERILDRCTTAWIDGAEVTLTKELIDEINALNTKLAENGLRCLSFAERVLEDTDLYNRDYPYNDGADGDYETPNFPLGQKEGDKVDPKAAEGLCFLGLMALVDPPRPAVPGAVTKCKTAGIKVIMVTGDHPVTAEAISYKVGILWSPTEGQIKKANEEKKVTKDMPGWVDPQSAEAVVVPGWDLDGKDEEWWNFILEHPQIVFARTSPQQKLIIVENCQRLGHIVAVTGDGVNDSPALKKANIGVAMGIMGSEVSKQAADMILLDDNFASIVAGVEEGRLIFDNLKKSICYTLTSNIPEISPFLCFVLIQTPLPLSTILILGIDLGTDMIPAISMAYERAEADIMMRPPRNSQVDRLVTKKLICFAYLQIGIIQAAAGFYSWMVVLNDYGFPPHILVGLGRGDYFNKQTLFCNFEGGQWVNEAGDVYKDTNGAIVDPSTTSGTREYGFWDRGDGGYINKCAYPLKTYIKSGSPSTNSDSWFTSQSNVNGKGTNSKGQVTHESITALEENNYFAYVPFRGRMSPFWQSEWMYYETTKDASGEFPGGPMRTGVKPPIYFQYQSAGLYSLCESDPSLGSGQTGSIEGTNIGKLSLPAWEEAAGLDFNSWPDDSTCTGKLTAALYKDATFCNGDGACDASVEASIHNVFYCENSCSAQCAAGAVAGTATYAEGKKQCANIASRMVQFEALRHSQGSYFTSIVVVQWADLLICKTRWLSIRDQGMSNSFMNFGLFFETILAACLAYVGWIQPALLTRNLRFTHWFPAIPFSILIFVYDETRKYLMRSTSPEIVDKATGQVKRQAGWLERNTYY